MRRRDASHDRARVWDGGVIAACALLCALAGGCSIGEGEGDVTSEGLFVENCWDGPLDLNPDFFAADPFGDSMTLRVQRGEQAVESSDGIILVVNDVAEIRENQLGQKLKMGLPVGVSPPGIPERVNLDPPKVSMSLYLHQTCHVQNAALYSVDGWIRFESLFSGDRNEKSAEDRLTDASFEAIVADPRDVTLSDEGVVTAGGTALVYPAERTSVVTGTLRFYFERGIPAQPFP